MFGIGKKSSTELDAALRKAKERVSSLEWEYGASKDRKVFEALRKEEEEVRQLSLQLGAAVREEKQDRVAKARADFDRAVMDADPAKLEKKAEARAAKFVAPWLGMIREDQAHAADIDAQVAAVREATALADAYGFPKESIPSAATRSAGSGIIQAKVAKAILEASDIEPTSGGYQLVVDRAAERGWPDFALHLRSQAAE
jgi:hypothetical protein